MTEVQRIVPIICPGHSRPLAEIQYSNQTDDGLFLISACLDKMPMLRRGENGDWVGTFEGHKGAVWSAKLNNNSSQAATGSADFSVKLWNAVTGDEQITYAHKHIVKSVAFSADDRQLLTGAHDKMMRVFDLHSGSVEPVHTMNHPAKINQALFAADPHMVVSGCEDSTIRVWDLRSGQEVRSVECPGRVMDLELSRDANMLTAAAGSEVLLLNASSFNAVSAFRMPINFLEEGGASLHPDGSRFIAGGSDLWVRVFDAKTGEELQCHKGHHGPVRCLRYSPDGCSFASGSEDGTIRIWREAPVAVESSGTGVGAVVAADTVVSEASVTA